MSSRATMRPGPISDRGWRRAATLVLLLATVLRLAPIAAHGFAPERVRTVDSAAYVDLARTLEEEGAFARDGRAETFRTPGYPLLLAAVDRLPGPLEPWIVGAQVLLGVLVVATALVLGRHWCSGAAGLVAGGLVALDPVQIVGSQLIMADVPAAAAVAGAFVLAERGRPCGALGAGLLLSVATALRPVTVLLGFPLALLLLHRGASRRVVALALVAAAAFPATWIVRNGVVADTWSLSTAFDLNLGLVVAPKVLARAEGIALAEAQRRVVELGGVHDPAQSGRSNRKVAAAVIAAHPGAALHELAASGAEMLLAGERRHVLQLLGVDPARTSIGEAVRGGPLGSALAGRRAGELILVAVQLLFNAAVLGLAAVGIPVLIRNRRVVEAVVIVACLALVLAPSLVVANARLRVPVSLFLAVSAGAGAAWALRLGGGRVEARAAMPAARARP